MEQQVWWAARRGRCATWNQVAVPGLVVYLLEKGSVTFVRCLAARGSMVGSRPWVKPASVIFFDAGQVAQPSSIPTCRGRTHVSLGRPPAGEVIRTAERSGRERTWLKPRSSSEDPAGLPLIGREVSIRPLAALSRTSSVMYQPARGRRGRGQREDSFASRFGRADRIGSRSARSAAGSSPSRCSQRRRVSPKTAPGSAAAPSYASFALATVTRSSASGRH